MKQVSVVITVKNEEDTIDALLATLAAQTLSPSEVIVTDACSTDRTWQLLKRAQKKFPQLHLRIEQFPCNRSVGRNVAIAKAMHDLIASTDAGCVLDPKWLSSLVKEYDEYMSHLHAKNSDAAHSSYPVVAGLTLAAPRSSFEHAVAPFFIPSARKINPRSFLPTTRSMLFHRQTWKAVGQFNELLQTSEDYEFSLRVRARGIPILFTPNARVYWRPPTNLHTTAKLFFTFARSDVLANVMRRKAVFVLVRYAFGVGVLLLVPLLPSAEEKLLLFLGVVLILVLYCAWAIMKLKRETGGSWYLLPLLQFVADAAVITGSIAGLLTRGLRNRYARHESL